MAGSSAQYPERLSAVLVEQSLTPSILSGWSVREALVERGDSIAVHELLARIARAVLATVLAVNRIYQPHCMLKWQRHLTAGCDAAPYRLAERLESMWHGSERRALANAEMLLTETLELAEQRSVDVLMRVYAKCIYGQEEVARRRIQPLTPQTTSTRIRREAGDPGVADGEHRQPSR